MDEDFLRVEQRRRWDATQVRLAYRPPPVLGQPPLEEMPVGPPIDWTPLIMTLLLGTQDIHSPLSLFQGSDIVRLIFEMLIYKYKEGAVTITPPAYSAARLDPLRWQGGAWWPEGYDRVDDQDKEMLTTNRGEFPVVHALIPQRRQRDWIGLRKRDRPQIAFSPCGSVEFPDPVGININMMPFIMGDRKSLPQELWPYYDKIIDKCPVQHSEVGDVMYLTVQESHVKANETQRRPGLHIEAPSGLSGGGEFSAALEHRWGHGGAFFPDELHGGLYVASNKSNTTAIWNALVDGKLGGVDTYGGMNHLRPYIGRGKKLPANLLVWLTDRMPHEALPQDEDGQRQFFRLVTSDISVWYAAHSTPNPKVPVPAHVKIIGESKFKSSADNANVLQRQQWMFASDDDSSDSWDEKDFLAGLKEGEEAASVNSETRRSLFRELFGSDDESDVSMDED